MIADPDLYVLAQINSGLRSDLQKLHALNASLQRLIDGAKVFQGAALADASGDWITVDQSLRDVRHYTQLIETGLTSEEVDPPENWKTILRLETVIQTTFVRLQDAVAATLPAAHKVKWDDLWQTIFLELAAIRAHAAMAQAKAEMRLHYGSAVADQMAQEVLSHLPENASLAEAVRYADEYRKASVEYEQHKDNFGGFFGIVKALFLIPDAAPNTLARQRM